MKREIMMFSKLTNFAKPTTVPDDIEAIVSSVAKSPELIGAEEKLATLRARHTGVYDKIRSLNSTRGRQIDAHEEGRRDREVTRLDAERIEVEEQIREAKANRNDLSWPWKLAVAEAAKPMLEVKAKELRDHIVEVKKLTAEFIDITVRFPGSINQTIPMSHPGVQGWLEFARKILGEKILWWTVKHSISAAMATPGIMDIQPVAVPRCQVSWHGVRCSLVTANSVAIISAILNSEAWGTSS